MHCKGVQTSIYCREMEIEIGCYLWCEYMCVCMCVCVYVYVYVCVCVYICVCVCMYVSGIIF